jgi:hypothetical protein
MLTWRTGINGDLTVRVAISNQGGGVFLLQRLLPGGVYDEIGAAGDALNVPGTVEFEFDAQQVAAWGDPVSMRLSITGGNPSNTDMPVFLSITQPGGALSPVDDFGNPLPTDGDGYRQLDPVLHNNQLGIWEFDIWFS